MKRLTLPRLPALGAPAGGGFFAGVFLQGNQLRKLFVAGPQGEFRGEVWNTKYGLVKGALSMDDGLANTKAMAKAGSAVAGKIIELRLGGERDWYLMSREEAWTAYKNLKFNAAGAALLKKKGGGEFADGAYWTSTCYRAHGNYAWDQGVTYGSQGNWLMVIRLVARACRSEPI